MTASRCIALATLAALVAGCREYPTARVVLTGGSNGGGGVPTVADRQLAWNVPGPRGFGEPTVGEDAVYFLAVDHTVRAIPKSGGASRWVTQLPIAANLLPGYSSLLLPGQLIVADQDVFSLDPATGAIQWQFHTDVGRRPGADAPVLSGETLFTGSGTGHVFALDRATGALRWRQAVADSTDSVFQPAVAGGTVYVGVSRYPPFPAPNSGRVVALDAQSGRIRWSRDLPSLVARPQSGARDVVLLAGFVIAVSGDGIIHALDTASGATRWNGPRAQPPPGSGFTEPVDVDGRGLSTDGTRLYATSGIGSIEAFSPADGKRLWGSPANLGGLFNVRADGRNVFSVHIGGQLGVIDASTGAVRWSFDGARFQTVPGERFVGTAGFDATNFYVSGSEGFYAFRKE